MSGDEDTLISMYELIPVFGILAEYINKVHKQNVEREITTALKKPGMYVAVIHH